MKKYSFKVYQEDKYYTEIEAETQEEAEEILIATEPTEFEFLSGQTDWKCFGEAEK